MKQARIYTRLSGSSSERSIDSQFEDCKAYIQKQDDLKFDHWYNEGRGESGWDESREEYQQMLEDAENGEFDALIVRQGSRIGRETLERVDTFTDLANKYEVEFHTTRRGFIDPDNPMDFLMEVFSATKDDEKRQEIELAQEAIEERVEKGHFHGRPPYGFCYDDAGEYWIPDHDSEGDEKSDFQKALDVIQKREDGLSWRDIAAETDVHKDTARNIWDRRDRYLQEVETV